MKKALIASTLVLLIGTSVAAMANPGMDGKGVDRLKSALGLNDTQATQIDALMQERKDHMDALRTEYDTRIQAVLTPEQVTKFTELKQKRDGRGGEGRGHGERGGSDAQPG